MKWISIDTARPTCSNDPDALGTPVLIWPRDNHTDRQHSMDGFAYYGRRATGRPTFYLFGAEIHGVTHWMPMPEGQK